MLEAKSEKLVQDGDQGFHDVQAQRRVDKSKVQGDVGTSFDYMRQDHLILDNLLVLKQVNYTKDEAFVDKTLLHLRELEDN